MNKATTVIIALAMSSMFLAGCGDTPQEKALKNVTTVTQLKQEQSKSIVDVLEKCGITEFKITADKTQDNLQGAGEKGYVLTYKNIDDIIMLIDPNGSVWKIMCDGQYLYSDGTVQHKIDEFYMSDDEREDMINTTSAIIGMYLTHPETAVYSNKEDWRIKKSPNGFRVSAHVTNKNAFGMEVNNSFIVRFTPDKNTAQVMINNQDMGQLDLGGGKEKRKSIAYQLSHPEE